jgi:hypothetical protein
MFKTMGYTSDLKAKGLLADLTGKLPLSMRESWGRFVVKADYNPDVELFHKWLTQKEEAFRFGGGLEFAKQTKPVKFTPKPYSAKTSTIFCKDLYSFYN